MIRTLIIEDEEPAALRLKKLLLDSGFQIEVIDTLDTIESSVKWFLENPHPDLLMLDIQLADGLSFDIFKKVEVNSFVIFTTAYDEYAIKAFELNSIDYLLKPIDNSKLLSSLEKFAKLRDVSNRFDITTLIETIESKSTRFKKRFAISLGTKIKSIETKDIAFFYSLEKNTFLQDKSGKSYPVDFSLDKLEQLLDPEIFFRVSRQFIVNFKAIIKIHILSKSRLELEVDHYDDRILVSTAKSHSFRHWIDK